MRHCPNMKRMAVTVGMGVLCLSVTNGGTALAAPGNPVNPQVRTGVDDQSADAKGPFTTVHQTIVGGLTTEALAPYYTLRRGPGWPRIVRTDLGASPDPGRKSKRVSLLYFAQLSDFQLADEESPARVESIDGLFGASGAWRPQEALSPYIIDAAIAQVNRFVRSPIKQGSGERSKMQLALTTGDSADNMQRNEVEWVVKLLEGGALSPNSGVDNPDACPNLPEGEAARYTGVQDYGDYPTGVKPGDTFYDPNQPTGGWSQWPSYPGLMDRAQKPFVAQGLAVPSYVTFGNHDGLSQGNFTATTGREQEAIGCKKKFTGSATAEVPPDPNRQFVDKKQYRSLHDTSHSPNQHGFAYVDPSEAAASNGAASYYSFSPAAGIKMISIDTVAEGGGSEGNIDDPQFAWLRKEIKKAEADGQLVIVFGHHTIGTLTTKKSDEQAEHCTKDDEHGHDLNPGCDRDPRSSKPIRVGSDLVTLLSAHPNVVAYVAGHTHAHEINAYKGSKGGGFWEIVTASETDWPIQSRLIEVMDNSDGTLSIFATLIDHSGAVSAPASGTSADSMDALTLAAVARTFSFNDPLTVVGEPTLGGEYGLGAPDDRNVELLLPDPRHASKPSFP